MKHSPDAPTKFCPLAEPICETGLHCTAVHTTLLGSLREYMGHERLNKSIHHDACILYASLPICARLERPPRTSLVAPGPASSRLPGPQGRCRWSREIVLVRTGHVGTGIEGLRFLLGPASPPTLKVAKRLPMVIFCPTAGTLSPHARTPAILYPLCTRLSNVHNPRSASYTIT